MSKNKWIHFMLKMSALGAVLLTVNCVSDTFEEAELDPASLTRDPFLKELSKQYHLFVTDPAAPFREEKNHYFAIKGLKAIQGVKVLPEDPRKTPWHVPEDKLESLMAERHHLISSLMKKGAEVAPQQAAAAQAGYDCMIAQMSDDTDYASSAILQRCQNMFTLNLNTVETAVQKVAPLFTFYFHKNHWSLSREDQVTIHKIAEIARVDDKVVIGITGYTDADGGHKHNLILSQKRAQTVRDALKKLRVDEGRMVAMGAGEIEGATEHPEYRKVVVQIHYHPR